MVNITFTMSKSEFKQKYYARRNEVARESCLRLNETESFHTTKEREQYVRLEHYCSYYDTNIQEWSLKGCLLKSFTESKNNKEDIELLCSCNQIPNYITVGTMPKSFFSDDVARKYINGTDANQFSWDFEYFSKTVHAKQLLGLWVVFIMGIILFLLVDLCFTWHFESKILNGKFLKVIDDIRDELGEKQGEPDLDDNIFNLKIGDMKNER